MISMICIIGKNREIGYKNKLLWNITDDMKHFKDITTGHPVIMGSKTYESIGRALSDRENYVLSSNPDYLAPGCIICNSLQVAIEQAKLKNNEIFIIGGGSVYEQALPLTDKLYLTLVDDAPEADTYFPDYSQFNNIIKEEEREYNGLKFKFVELTK